MTEEVEQIWEWGLGLDTSRQADPGQVLKERRGVYLAAGSGEQVVVAIVVRVAHPFHGVGDGRQLGLGQDQDGTGDQRLEHTNREDRAGGRLAVCVESDPIGTQVLPEVTQLVVERVSPIRLAIVADLSREQGGISRESRYDRTSRPERGLVGRPLAETTAPGRKIAQDPPFLGT